MLAAVRQAVLPALGAIEAWIVDDTGYPKKGTHSVGVVLADAGYGNDTDFRLGIGALGLTYIVGIQGSTTVWAEGQQPLPPRDNWGRGRPVRTCASIQSRCGSQAERATIGVADAFYAESRWPGWGILDFRRCDRAGGRGGGI